MSAAQSAFLAAQFEQRASTWLAADRSYQSAPGLAAALPQDGRLLGVFLHSRRSGMAVNINLIVIWRADGLTPIELSSRLDTVATLTQGIGEQGNADARRGGPGRQVATQTIWLYVGSVEPSVAQGAAALRREARGSVFGRWPVTCAAVALADGRAYAPPHPPWSSGAGLAADLLRATQEYGDHPIEPAGTVAADSRRRDLAALFTARSAPATYALLVVIALLFVAMQLSGGATSVATLARFGALVPSLTISGEWWRLVTAAFLHIGWAHILFNGWALYIYGPLVERLYGPWRFLAMYLLAAVAGDVLSLPFVSGVSAGASGAIFGLFGVTLSLTMRHRATLPAWVRQPLWRNAAAVVGLNIVFSLALTGINLYAHAGGFIAGLVLGAIFRPRPTVSGKPQGPAGDLAGMLLTAVSAIAIAVGLVAG